MTTRRTPIFESVQTAGLGCPCLWKQWSFAAVLRSTTEDYCQSRRGRAQSISIFAQHPTFLKLSIPPQAVKKPCQLRGDC
eukprot:3745047-Amphidinium_carterae.1